MSHYNGESRNIGGDSSHCSNARISHIKELTGDTSTDVDIVETDWRLERLQAANHM